MKNNTYYVEINQVLVYNKKDLKIKGDLYGRD